MAEVLSSGSAIIKKNNASIINRDQIMKALEFNDKESELYYEINKIGEYLKEKKEKWSF